MPKFRVRYIREREAVVEADTAEEAAEMLYSEDRPDHERADDLEVENSTEVRWTKEETEDGTEGTGDRAARTQRRGRKASR